MADAWPTTVAEAPLWRSPHEALHAARYTPFERTYFGRHVSAFAAPNKHLHMLGTMDAIFHKTHHLLQPLVGHHSVSGGSPASCTPLEHQISLLLASQYCREDNWQQLAIAASQAILQYANHYSKLLGATRGMLIMDPGAERGV